MAGKSPKNFRIADSARTKILSIIENVNRFDASDEWLAAIVWSTSEHPEGNVVGSGPGIGVYPKAAIAGDLILSIAGLMLVFPNSDQTHFENNTLSYDSISDRFCLTPNQPH